MAVSVNTASSSALTTIRSTSSCSTVCLCQVWLEAVARRHFHARQKAALLRSLFAEAGLADVETDTVRHTFVLPSFDAYYGPFERGGASNRPGTRNTAGGDTPRAVREEVRRDLAESGGPVEAEAEYRIASARR